VKRLRGIRWVLAVLLVALTVSACSVSINTGATPTPSPSPSNVAKPSPTPSPTSVVISYQLDTAQCQTGAQVTVSIGGDDVGTMSVATHTNTTDRLTVMMAPVAQKYSLKGIAFFQVNGQSFGLNVSGKGTVPVADGPNSWALAVDGSRVSTNGCPSEGSSWPLVVQTS
jgi:hypothetical protein